jgi:hypothetical protein
MGEDEEGTLARLKAHRKELIDPQVAEHRGRIVKTTGDGTLIEFPSVVDAVRCAIGVQRGMAERDAIQPENARIEFCPREDVLRKPEPARSALLRMLGAEERMRAKIDRETGYAAKVAEVQQLDERADALRVLWFAEPATTLCGITLKLRAWLLHADPYPSSDDYIERAALAALADAERLCGVRHMTPLDRPPESPAFAERTKADFSAHA